MSDQKIILPEIHEQAETALLGVIQSLGISRDVLAQREDIRQAWAGLPGILSKIPERNRNELLARMCIAVSAGLFDAAINYIWNIAISELRRKIIDFGLGVVGQMTSKTIDEKELNELKDAELIKLCLQLNLMTEEGYFFLDQCRDIRNNFSIAHPPVGVVDQYELLNFVNRCAKYALFHNVNHRGVDLSDLLKVIRVSKFNDIQLTAWNDKIAATHDAQRDLIFSALHGIFCDPAVGEEARINAGNIAKAFSATFSDKLKSTLIDRHHDYSKRGDEPRYKMSQRYFSSLGIMGLLGSEELHVIITKACSNLIGTHQAFSNFYNEPPFAERLLEIVSGIAVPDSAKVVYVETVITCSVGSEYGTSNAADNSYLKMIKGFSQREIGVVIGLPKENTIVAQRIKAHKRCKAKYVEILKSIDPQSVHESFQKAYQGMLAGHF